MSDSNSPSPAGCGIGFLSLLTIVFIILKILGKITWSWWWVLAPIWMSWALVLSVLVIFLVVMAVVVWVKG